MPIFVVEEAHADHLLILGRPFFVTARARLDDKSGRCVLKLVDEFGDPLLQVGCTRRGDTANKTREDIFPLN